MREAVPSVEPDTLNGPTLRLPCVGARLRAIRGFDRGRFEAATFTTPRYIARKRAPTPEAVYLEPDTLKSPTRGRATKMRKDRAAAIRRDFLSGCGGDGDYFLPLSLRDRCVFTYLR